MIVVEPSHGSVYPSSPPLKLVTTNTCRGHSHGTCFTLCETVTEMAYTNTPSTPLPQTRQYLLGPSLLLLVLDLNEEEDDWHRHTSPVTSTST